MPPKKKRGGNKRKRAESPTPSEQELLNALPVAGDLVTRAEQKSTSYVVPAYLIYVVLRTDPDKTAEVVIRKAYESKTEGAEAFQREYGMWTTCIYPGCHTEKELSRAHLINLIDAMRRETSALPYEVVADPPLQDTVYIGRGKIEYAIVHRDDKEIDNKDHRQRKVMIVCEETRYEAL